MTFHSAALDRKQWALFPSEAKTFLLQNNHVLDIQKLVNFWSRAGRLDGFLRKGVKTFTPEFSRTYEAVATASYLLAKDYLRKDDAVSINRARGMIMNAGLFNQCEYTNIEQIAEIFRNGIPADDVLRTQLPLIYKNKVASESAESMKNLLYQKIKADIAREKDSAPEFVRWNSMESSNKSSQSTNDADDIIIEVNLDDGKKIHKMNIPSRTSLKQLLSMYAEGSGNCSQSVHITHNEKTLFQSSCGKLGVGSDLGIQSGDTIRIRNRVVPDKENVSNQPTTRKSSSSSKSKKHVGKSKKKGSKKSSSKGKSMPSYQDETTDENKVKHSRSLTAVFEEAEPKFREIRKLLNDLNLERAKPKKRGLSERSTNIIEPVSNPRSEGMGGKAGKTHFMIQVGEVENLYKTSKPSVQRKYSSTTNQKTLSLDLHGYSKKEAVDKLNSCLPSWIDTAMHGSYPWVIPVTVICGGGNQILSETVEQWIRQNEKVSNAPKSAYA